MKGRTWGWVAGTQLSLSLMFLMPPELFIWRFFEVIHRCFWERSFMVSRSSSCSLYTSQCSCHFSWVSLFTPPHPPGHLASPSCFIAPLSSCLKAAAWYPQAVTWWPEFFSPAADSFCSALLFFFFLSQSSRHHSVSHITSCTEQDFIKAVHGH